MYSEFDDVVSFYQTSYIFPPNLVLFKEEDEKKLKQKGFYKKTSEKSHGQIEIQEYYNTEEIKWIACKNEWKGLKSVGIAYKYKFVQSTNFKLKS